MVEFAGFSRCEGAARAPICRSAAFRLWGFDSLPAHSVMSLQAGANEGQGRLAAVGMGVATGDGDAEGAVVSVAVVSVAGVVAEKEAVGRGVQLPSPETRRKAVERWGWLVGAAPPRKP